MKKIIILCTCLAGFVAASAQAQFPTTVRIEYERLIYQHAVIKSIDEEWYRNVKDNVPQSTTSKFELITSGNKSIYKAMPSNDAGKRMSIEQIIGKNAVYTDFDKKIRISQRPLFEETFLVTDSLLKIKWMITADTREIAGFNCRKAVGILNDSIGIFAFYSEEIPVTGGPESIQGLPGMILGLGVPRLHTTWFATSVQITNVNTALVKPETKGKQKSAKEVDTTIGDFMSRQERWGRAIKFFFMI